MLQLEKQKQRKTIRDFSFQNSHTFNLGDGEKRKTNIVKHKTDTGNAILIRQTARWLPLTKMDEAKKIIKDMTKKGGIEPSDNPWATPEVIVIKIGEMMGFCVDYGVLNNVTRNDIDPLRRIDNTWDVLEESNIFLTLDLRSAYWQVKLSEESKTKAALNVGTGLWQFRVIPFSRVMPQNIWTLNEKCRRLLSLSKCSNCGLKVFWRPAETVWGVPDTAWK